MEPKNITEGTSLYDTGMRLGREKYTHSKFEYFQVENHPDAKNRLINEWVDEALDSLERDLGGNTRLTFEAGFMHGIEKARNGTNGGSIVVG